MARQNRPLRRGGGGARLGAVILASILGFAGIVALRASGLVGSVLLALGLLIFSFSLILQSKEQEAKDTAAKSILDDLVNNREISGPIFLYLRSFALGKWDEAKMLANFARNVAFTTPVNVVFREQASLAGVEGRLSATVERYGPLLAIGNKEISYGAGKIISSDEDWQATFAVLARQAAAIFFMPENSPSVRWEIRQILEDAALRSKTIWIMASGLESDQWSPIRAAANEQGWIFPKHHDLGYFFYLHEDGRIFIRSADDLLHRLNEELELAALSEPDVDGSSRGPVELSFSRDACRLAQARLEAAARSRLNAMMKN